MKQQRAILFALATLLCYVTFVEATFRHRKLILSDGDDALEGRYIVSFQQGVDPFDVLSSLPVSISSDETYLELIDGEPTSSTAVIQGIDAGELQNLLDDAGVAYIEPDRRVQPHVVQRIPWLYGNWGLDKIDNPSRELNKRYRFQSSGENVELYVLDSGAEDHPQFEDREYCGYDVVDGNCRDEYGHGLHVATTAAGIGYGVAKDASVVTVRVLSGSDGSGSVSGVLRGMDFVMGQKQQRPNVPMVVNMSLGSSFSRAMNDGVTRLTNLGVVVVVSAGNDSKDACDVSPASSQDAITVGSIDKDNERSSFSNYGPCVNIFAPGDDIRAASKGGFFDFFSLGGKKLSGTSMAAPFVSGVAALYLEQNPTMTVLEVRQQILDDAASDIVGDHRNAGNLVVSSAALYESTGVRSEEDDEMCTGIFGSCGGGIGCCDGRICLPIFGLCFIF